VYLYFFAYRVPCSGIQSHRLTTTAKTSCVQKRFFTVFFLLSPGSSHAVGSLLAAAAMLAAPASGAARRRRLAHRRRHRAWLLGRGGPGLAVPARSDGCREVAIHFGSVGVRCGHRRMPASTTTDDGSPSRGRGGECSTPAATGGSESGGLGVCRRRHHRHHQRAVATLQLLAWRRCSVAHAAAAGHCAGSLPPDSL
jgi:hypothetical protein